jgi:hypothetical protein
VKGLLAKVIVGGLLLGLTIVAYGACFHGWFLPAPLNKPVSLREGSTRGRTHGLAYYFIGRGRGHYGGGYRGGK